MGTSKNRFIKKAIFKFLVPNREFLYTIHFRLFPYIAHGGLMRTGPQNMHIFTRMKFFCKPFVVFFSTLD